MLGLGGEVWVLGWALVSGGGDKKYKISKKNRITSAEFIQKNPFFES